MLFGGRSHIGLVRQMNQDSYAIYSELTPIQFALVADGMGGASAGEVASQMAVEAVSAYIQTALVDDVAIDPNDLLACAIQVANQKIWEAAKENPAYVGMGTTVVACLLDQTHITFANVGDSRGYLYHAGELTQVTRDHSLVAELVRRGQLTEEEAHHHPQRSIVTRSLGTSEFNRPDIESYSWESGDLFLLCSDGLSNLVTVAELSDQVSRVVDAPETLTHVVNDLVRLALERGGPDNITLVIGAHAQVGDPS